MKALNFPDSSHALRARVAFLRGQDDAWPDLGDDRLLATLEQWLGPYANGKSMLSLNGGVLHDALRSLLDYDQQRDLDRLAPESPENADRLAYPYRL